MSTAVRKSKLLKKDLSVNTNQGLVRFHGKFRVFDYDESIYSCTDLDGFIHLVIIRRSLPPLQSPAHAQFARAMNSPCLQAPIPVRLQAVAGGQAERRSVRTHGGGPAGRAVPAGDGSSGSRTL